VQALEPDLIVVACFPRLLPADLVSLAPHGGINLHPSLLPAFRGPEPLFWTLRSGLRESGVTAHQLSDRFDAGAIYAQTHLTVPFGERLETIERVFAEAAGRLAVDVIDAIAQGTVTPLPQPDHQASAAPIPTVQDFTVPASWTAERAYAFTRAVAPLGGPLAVIDAIGQTVPVRDAESWTASLGRPPAPAATCDRIWVRFVTGYVCFLKVKI
jgi:methionyl-tRNA formyltransferase